MVARSSDLSTTRTAAKNVTAYVLKVCLSATEVPLDRKVGYQILLGYM